MPILSVWFIRSALVYLAAGFTIGAVLLANKAVSFFPFAWNFLPVHTEFLMAGFVIQLTLGVAFWIFPRFLTSADRGNEKWAQWSFGLLNAGIAVFCLCAFLAPHLSFLGRLLESAGVVCFAVHIWPRIYSTRNG